eukprot:4111461-Pleurochrysis_carterae.AAC.1
MAADSASNVDAAREAGKAAFIQGNFEEARLRFSEALEANPTDAVLLSNRSAALDKLGRQEEAVQDAREAVRADPTYAKAHYRLATALLALGRAGEAESVADTASKRFPANGQLRTLRETAKMQR